MPTTSGPLGRNRSRIIISSLLPQNRCLAERVRGKASRLALAVADHETTLVHRSPERRGLRRHRQTDARLGASGNQGDPFAETKGLPWKVDPDNVGRITKLRLVRPGSLVSNKIAFFG